MKLISMTDYTLQTLDNDVTVSYGIRDKVRQIRVYAEFLNQPLKLSMFVPCDDKGNILEEPQLIDRQLGFDEIESYYDQEECETYKKAKEKVLFKDCFFDKASEIVFYKSYETPLFINVENWNNESVESLTVNNLELTETAINQLK